AHPTWAMGPVVTVNSASLMNKGLELIEAHLLFDVPADDITVVVHPQSVVHSMVERVDGSTIARAAPPDRRLPIARGLSWRAPAPAGHNAANEGAGAAVLSGRAGFGVLVAPVERVLPPHDGAPAGALTLEHVAAAEAWARARPPALLDRR